MTTKVSPTFVPLTVEDVANAKSDSPARFKIKGRMTTLASVRRLVLADGTRVYKCPVCFYGNEKPTSIMPHSKVHSPAEREAAIARYDGNAVAAEIVDEALATPAVVSVNGASPLITDLERYIEERHTDIADRDGRIAELVATLAVRDERIATLETALRTAATVL